MYGSLNLALPITCSQYGITYQPQDALCPSIFSVKGQENYESLTLYNDILFVVREALDQGSRRVKRDVISSLQKRKISQVKLEREKMTITFQNGNTTEVEIPEYHLKTLHMNGILNNNARASVTLSLFQINDVVKDVIKEKGFKKVLYLYSSGGGGHVSAKNALRDNRLFELQKEIKNALTEKFGEEKGSVIFRQNFPDYASFVNYCKARRLYEEKDVLHDFVGPIGKSGTKSWDAAQKSGDVKKQERLAGRQKLSQVIFAPAVFIHTLLTLIYYHPEEVISTQAISNDAILSAIGVYNALFKPAARKNLNLHLYMTDMPTELSDHFFAPIRTMFKGQKKRLVLHAPKPNNGFTWDVKVGLEDNQVEVLENVELPIRPAFVQAVQKFQNTDYDPTKIEIKINSQEEREILESVIGNEPIVGDTKDGVHFVNYQLSAEDQAHYIMLGSQPTKSAIYDYIKKYIEIAKQVENKPLHLFLFAGKFLEGKDCFYKEISEHLKDQDLPPNLKVVPLSYQDADQMVSLFARCHSITRSGGGTCMELLVMDEVAKAIPVKNPQYKKPNRFVHAQVVPGRGVEDSIPLWERGNFHFMRDKLGATVVTPSTLQV